MKKIKFFQIFVLLNIFFFSCSETEDPLTEDPLTLVGSWEATVYREYENNTLVYIDDEFIYEDYVFIFRENGTIRWEIEGDLECVGTYESKRMDSKPQKVVFCGDEESLLTIKSNDKITLSFDYGIEGREEIDLIRL